MKPIIKKVNNINVVDQTILQEENLIKLGLTIEDTIGITKSYENVVYETNDNKRFFLIRDLKGELVVVALLGVIDNEHTYDYYTRGNTVSLNSGLSVRIASKVIHADPNLKWK